LGYGDGQQTATERRELVVKVRGMKEMGKRKVNKEGWNEMLKKAELVRNNEPKKDITK